MVGTVVCIAASIAGDTSQDLKTGFVLGATPRSQQIGELVGVVTSAGIVAWTIGYLHRSELATGGLGGTELPAPQGVLMGLVIDGVLEQSLPWILILIGAGIAMTVAVGRIPPLPFAVGLYLPLYTMAAVFLGGLSRWVLTRNQSPEEAERRREQGVLVGSGMVGGEGLTGVLLAIWVVTIGDGERIAGVGVPPWVFEWLPVVAISLIVALLFHFARRRVS